MNRLLKFNFNVRQICLTAYKGLFLLKHLIVQPLSKEEIIDLFKNDEFAPFDISAENLRVILNSLKELGCKIPKPDLKNDYKYVLEKNPFSLNLTKEEVKLINRLRKNLKVDLDTVLGLNSFINTLCLNIADSEIKESLKNHNYLTEIKPSLIGELKKCCESKSNVILDYISGRKLTKLEMQTYFLKYEKGRLYVWGYSPKYDDISYLRVDKIKGITATDKNFFKNYDNFTIRYKMYNPNYILEEYETEVERKENEIIIDYQVQNRFSAIQKFLEKGSDCKIISPKSFKTEFIQTLKLIKEGYKNE